MHKHHDWNYEQPKQNSNAQKSQHKVQKLQNMKPFRKNNIKEANIQYMKTNIKTCYRNISDHIEDSEIERER